MTAPIIFEAQVRDTQSHTSDSMDADADVVVNVDDLTGYTFEDADKAVLYVDDDHDAAYDLTVRHTHHEDGDDYAAELAHTTYAVSSGQDQTRIVVEGPVGLIRLHFATGALASAPTKGRTRVTAYLKQ